MLPKISHLGSAGLPGAGWAPPQSDARGAQLQLSTLKPPPPALGQRPPPARWEQPFPPALGPQGPWEPCPESALTLALTPQIETRVRGGVMEAPPGAPCAGALPSSLSSRHTRFFSYLKSISKYNTHSRVPRSEVCGLITFHTCLHLLYPHPDPM